MIYDNNLTLVFCKNEGTDYQRLQLVSQQFFSKVYEIEHLR